MNPAASTDELAGGHGNTTVIRNQQIGLSLGGGQGGEGLSALIKGSDDIASCFEQGSIQLGEVRQVIDRIYGRWLRTQHMIFGEHWP